MARPECMRPIRSMMSSGMLSTDVPTALRETPLSLDAMSETASSTLRPSTVCLPSTAQGSSASMAAIALATPSRDHCLRTPSIDKSRWGICGGVELELMKGQLSLDSSLPDSVSETSYTVKEKGSAHLLYWQVRAGLASQQLVRNPLL